MFCDRPRAREPGSDGTTSAQDCFLACESHSQQRSRKGGGEEHQRPGQGQAASRSDPFPSSLFSVLVFSLNTVPITPLSRPTSWGACWAGFRFSREGEAWQPAGPAGAAATPGLHPPSQTSLFPRKQNCFVLP